MLANREIDDALRLTEIAITKLLDGAVVGAPIVWRLRAARCEPNSKRKPETAVLRNHGLVPATFQPTKLCLARRNGPWWAFGSRHLGNPGLSLGADIQQRGVNDYTPLHYAAASDDLPAIELLLAHGADPNARTRIDHYATPLEEAQILGRSKAVQALRRRASGRGRAEPRRP